jgi:6-phosphogluconate dehydrogenase
MKTTLFIMGVSGVGKTTIGKLLAEKTKWPFLDGDDFHPPANIQKMKRGEALTDDDRMPWLQALNAKAREERDQPIIIACSALKKKYRKVLADGLRNDALFCWLNGDAATIRARMQQRNHFMPVALLDSQLNSLERPENALELNIKKSPHQLVNTIINHMKHPEFGIAGMGVMGRSIARNFALKGYKLALYNRHVKHSEEKVAQKTIAQYQELSTCQGYDDIGEFVRSLKRPRKLLVMVEAGKAVDEMINALMPHLQKGDVIIDGGNSHYKDTERRIEQCGKKGVHLLGCGISGGEKGARLGPAIMPGGAAGAYELVRPYLESVAAKNHEGQPCCAHISTGGSGHYVKMIHNGIEYAEMQLIAEVYGILRHALGYKPDEIAAVFSKWNKKKNNAYLLEISSQILSTKVEGTWIIDKIHDSAGNKGTGGWTALDSIERGHAFSTSVAALFSRFLSADWKWRKSFSEQVKKKRNSKVHLHIDALQQALYLSRLVNHHLGFELIHKTAIEMGWDIHLSQLATIWSNGCIIRSAMMVRLAEVLKSSPLILLDEQITSKIGKQKKALVDAIHAGMLAGVDVSVLSAAANYLNAATTYPGTTALIQAQRDFFGAHTFQWIDQPEGKAVHYLWEED